MNNRKSLVWFIFAHINILIAVYLSFGDNGRFSVLFFLGASLQVLIGITLWMGSDGRKRKNSD